MDSRRARIQAAIGRASHLPVTLLVAPAGTGKSTALGHFLESIDESVDGAALRFDVRAAHTTLTRFVRGVAATLQPKLPKVSQSLSIAHERATQSARPADVLAIWLAEHLRDTRRTIVIDNYHHCENDPTIAAFVAGVVERTRPTTRWIIATRSAAQLPFATWLARGDTTMPIGEAQLRLTAAEAAFYTERIAPRLDAHAARQLLEATSASIGQMLFALQTTAADAAIAKRVLDAGGNAFERCVDETLALLTPVERRLVIESSRFPDLDETLLSAAGHLDAHRQIASLQALIPQAFEGHGPQLRYKTLFADVLWDRLVAQGVDAVHDAHARTGHALATCDRIVEALAYYIHGRQFSAIAQLIESRGLAFVEAGCGDTIQEAIETLDPIARTSSPVILAIRATFESRLGRFDTAESLFQLALDRATDAGVRNHIAYQYGTHLLRFQRPEAIELLETLAEDGRASGDLRCYARSALGPAYVFARRYDEALASIDAALELAQTSFSTHLRARAFHQAAYVALFRGDGARAKTLATLSLELAERDGFFDISAGALTVLYNVASDLEDDPLESLRLLDAVAECAAKSGSLTNHLLALVAKLEIEVERGDEDAIGELDEKLRTIDVQSCGRAMYEALVASQALRAGWDGDFAGAYHLLLSSAELQWSADRKALRWAEISVYAAAAGLAVEATMAVRSSVELLDSLAGGHRIARARLFLALTMILLGRIESAAELFELIDADPHASSPRLQALRRALQALSERYRGIRNQGALIGLFQTLAEQQFGGVARMIMTFPLADNATLRLGSLNWGERSILAKLTRGDLLVSARQVETIVAKLGCHDIATAMRAVTRNAHSPELGAHVILQEA
jgi:ATP/maltotriose-dependent transcriptional regulator MalT